MSGLSFSGALSASGGKLRFSPGVRQAMDRWAASVPDGTSLVMTITEEADARSRRANSYYWAVVVPAAVELTGHTADEIHAFFCAQFIPSEQAHVEFFNHMTGERLEADVDVRRSSKLGVTAFYDFVERCRELLARMGKDTPDPDPEFWRKRRAA